MYRKIFYSLIVGVFALAMTVVPALASGLDLVVNDGAVVTETIVNTNSNTGANVADGSYGGDGGDGGDIRAREVDDSKTGRGGNGGSSGDGGTVQTGSALAITDVTTEANNSDTRINRCACENGDDSGLAVVVNRTRTIQMTMAGANANTGGNQALGSEGGEGGNGGDIGSGDRNQFNNFNGGHDDDGGSDVEDSTTGIGGNGGAGGAGGLIGSGSSTSRTTVVNVLNRNITRILR